MNAIKWFIFILTMVVVNVKCQPPKCDHTPMKAKVLTPSDEENSFHLSIETKLNDSKYLPAQTYVVTLSTSNIKRPFKWFFITAEDPDVDNTLNEVDLTKVDVGTLKPLGGQSRYSEHCPKTVEETDNSDKNKVEVHWISPKQSTRPSVRLRAMVAENEEIWHNNITIVIIKDDMKPVDSPPYDAKEICSLCSEARYEVIFNGLWSRITHPYHYPKEPDTNGYSDMIGASHDYNFNLWEKDTKASPGLKQLAEKGNITKIQRDIISNISVYAGVRTLIKGKGHMHPHMSESTYALMRVDRFHHLFSVVVSLIPSPDWFLGTSRFELCTDDGWLEQYEIPLYPWDAGTANGISYESETSVTQPVDNIQRVQVGSFDEASPFYQMNLNDMKPFGWLKVQRLDVYPITDGSCTDTTEETRPMTENKIASDDTAYHIEQEEPNAAESRSFVDRCEFAEWGEWSTCVPEYGNCGGGFKTRTRVDKKNEYFRYLKVSEESEGTLGVNENNCDGTNSVQTVPCFINC